MKELNSAPGWYISGGYREREACAITIDFDKGYYSIESGGLKELMNIDNSNVWFTEDYFYINILGDIVITCEIRNVYFIKNQRERSADTNTDRILKLINED